MGNDLSMMAPGYAALLARATEVLGADDRVRAMWLSGSLGRGDADAASDLDLLVAVRDDDLDAFADEWEDWLAAITPTVLAKPLPFAKGCLFCVTADGLRLDVVSEPVSALPHTFFRHRALVLDKDGIDGTVPPPDAGRGPNPQALLDLVVEFLRDYHLYPTVAERGDWLLGLEGTHLVRTLLYRFFCELNQPLPATGIKRWSEKLTPDQRRVLEALPGATASDPASVTAAHEAAAQAFVTAARPALAQYGVAWPEAMEATVLASLRAAGCPTYADE